MLWVYDHYKYCISLSARSDFIRQNLTSIDGPRCQILTFKDGPRDERVEPLRTNNFHPPEVVSRYREPQLQVGENYSHLRSNFANLDVYTIISSPLSVT